jgi:transposase
MEFFSGLDVSMERTAICMVDDKGEVQLRTEIVTDPDAIAAALKPFLPRLRRAGHEAGSLSPWLQPELAKRGLPAVCLEARHVRAAMSAQRNKTDATDPLALAHIVRTGWFRQAHIKTESCRLRLLLTQRRNLKRHQGDGAHGLRRGGARGGSGRWTDLRADECHAVGAGDAVEAIPPAARPGGEVRRSARALSALHGDSGRGSGDGVDLRDGDR